MCSFPWCFIYLYCITYLLNPNLTIWDSVNTLYNEGSSGNRMQTWIPIFNLKKNALEDLYQYIYKYILYIYQGRRCRQYVWYDLGKTTIISKDTEGSRSLHMWNTISFFRNYKKHVNLYKRKRPYQLREGKDEASSKGCLLRKT